MQRVWVNLDNEQERVSCKMYNRLGPIYYWFFFNRARWDLGFVWWLEKDDIMIKGFGFGFPYVV